MSPQNENAMAERQTQTARSMGSWAGLIKDTAGSWAAGPPKQAKPTARRKKDPAASAQAAIARVLFLRVNTVDAKLDGMFLASPPLEIRGREASSQGQRPRYSSSEADCSARARGLPRGRPA